MRKKPTYKKLIQIERKNLPAFREKFHRIQRFMCPLLDVFLPIDQMSVDHKHKRKKDPIGLNGDGLIRGVIQIQANALEGKITNNWKRLGLGKYTTLPVYLRNLADYLENPPIEQRYIHPSEKPKPEKLMKRDFNRVVKYYFDVYPRAKKPPQYPKSGKLSTKMKEAITAVDEYIKNQVKK